jgi:chaperonin GroES
MALSPKALGDRMVVKPRGRDETTKGGIVLPGTATARPQQRQVVAAGPGMQLDGGTRVELDLKIGGTVLFAKYRAPSSRTSRTVC